MGNSKMWQVEVKAYHFPVSLRTPPSRGPPFLTEVDLVNPQKVQLGKNFRIPPSTRFLEMPISTKATVFISLELHQPAD